MNMAVCHHCKNAYSQTAETCDFCKQASQSDTLSEFGAIDPVNHSQPVSVFVHVLAAFSGIAGFFVAGNLEALLRVIFLPLLLGVNYYGLELILGSIFFITFLGLGALFGFVWDKAGWKLGFSLGSLVTAVWILAFLLDVYSSGFTFDRVVSFNHSNPSCVGRRLLRRIFGSKLQTKAAHKRQKLPMNSNVLGFSFSNRILT